MTGDKKENDRQYGKADNLETRISLYSYTTAGESFFQGIRKELDDILTREPTLSADRILELGCGTGALWLELADLFPDSEITLSDLSRGMLDKSRDTLSFPGNNRFSYKVIDYHDIPYDDDSFDIIISNHNLYHAKDLDKVLSEIFRVMKTGGLLVCSTNGDEHLAEIRELLRPFGLKGLWPNGVLTDIFGLDRGGDLLETFFVSLERHDFFQELRITEPQAVLDYFLSVRNPRVREIIEDKGESIRSELSSIIDRDGYFRVRAEGGFFTARKV